MRYFWAILSLTLAGAGLGQANALENESGLSTSPQNFTIGNPIDLSPNFQHMKVLGRTSQPIGHYLYCMKNLSDCSTNKESPLAPELTETRWQQILQVNGSVNASVLPVSDYQQYHRNEYWTLPGKYGDCEDYVLLKRKLLREKGWPAAALLITVVRQPNGEGHAVLTVRTKSADFILDNLKPEVFSWEKTEYHYVKRQSTLNAGHWIDIDDDRNIVGSIHQ